MHGYKGGHALLNRGKVRGVRKGLNKYICFECDGTGRVYVHNPERDYTTKCKRCEGFGERRITITLEEYDRLKEFENKQIPKPVIPNKRIPELCKCPICKTELCRDDEELRYCPTCGEALQV